MEGDLFLYDKRDHFEFDLVIFQFLDGDVPRHTSNGVNISQLIRFARVYKYYGLQRAK